MQGGIHEILGLTAGHVQPRAPHAITSRGLRKCDSFWKNPCSLPQPGPPHCGFDACGNHERQRALIVDLHLSVAHTERLQHFLRLPPNRIAIIRQHARLDCNVYCAPIARLDPHLNVRANLCAGMACFASCHLPVHHPVHTASSCVSRMAIASLSGPAASLSTHSSSGRIVWKRTVYVTPGNATMIRKCFAPCRCESRSLSSRARASPRPSISSGGRPPFSR